MSKKAEAAEPGTPEARWDRPVENPVDNYPTRPDAEALTDEQKKHLQDAKG